MKLTRRNLMFCTVVVLVLGLILTVTFVYNPFRTGDVRLMFADPEAIDLKGVVDVLSRQVRKYPRVSTFRIGTEFVDPGMPGMRRQLAVVYNRKARTVTTSQEHYDGTMKLTGSIGSVTDKTIYIWAENKELIPLQLGFLRPW